MSCDRAFRTTPAAHDNAEFAGDSRPDLAAMVIVLPNGKVNQLHDHLETPVPQALLQFRVGA
jgi:hypothetical protein